MFWAGTREGFVNELLLVHQAVKKIDHEAVVLPGGYDGLFNPTGMFVYPDQQSGLDFFDYVGQTPLASGIRSLRSS